MSSWCPGMAGHSWGTPLQSLLQGSIKHHLKAPRCPGHLLPYKRAGQDPASGEGQQARHKPKKPSASNPRLPTQRSTSQAITSVLFFLSVRLGLAALSRKLVTPTQAPQCKEIQNSLPLAGRRAFFCPNQDKPPCVLLASPSRLGTRSTHSSV
jgi:hypothetical protein